METNVIIGRVPWPVAAVTAVWFGFMAYKAGKNAVLWGIGGGVLGLVVTTLVMGLGQAAFIPFTSAEQSMFRIKIGALAIFLVLCLGWLFTGAIHPHLLTPWKQLKPPAKDLAKETTSSPPARPSGTAPRG